MPNQGMTEEIAIACSRCNGRKIINLPCSLCGDSTYDHNCNDEDIQCPECKGTGEHPAMEIIRRLKSELAESREQVRLHNNRYGSLDKQNFQLVAEAGELHGRIEKLQSELSTAQKAIEIVMIRLSQNIAIHRQSNGEWLLTDFTKNQLFGNIKNCIEVLNQALQSGKEKQ